MAFFIAIINQITRFSIIHTQAFKMKDNDIPLYSSPQLGQKVTTYAEQHSTPLPKYIGDYHADISANREDSYYMSSVFQSQYNTFLAKSTGTKRGR